LKFGSARHRLLLNLGDDHSGREALFGGRRIRIAR
jgi:hypothetical protein